MFGFSLGELILGLLLINQSAPFPLVFADMFTFFCVDIEQCKCRVKHGWKRVQAGPSWIWLSRSFPETA